MTRCWQVEAKRTNKDKRRQRCFDEFLCKVRHKRTNKDLRGQRCLDAFVGKVWLKTLKRTNKDKRGQKCFDAFDGKLRQRFSHAKSQNRAPEWREANGDDCLFSGNSTSLNYKNQTLAHFKLSKEKRDAISLVILPPSFFSCGHATL